MILLFWVITNVWYNQINTLWIKKIYQGLYHKPLAYIQRDNTIVKINVEKKIIKKYELWLNYMNHGLSLEGWIESSCFLIVSCFLLSISFLLLTKFSTVTSQDIWAGLWLWRDKHRLFFITHVSPRSTKINIHFHSIICIIIKTLSSVRYTSKQHTKEHTLKSLDRI